MKQRQLAPAPASQRARRQSPHLRYLCVERVSLQAHRYYMLEEFPDDTVSVITAVRTRRAFAWDDEPTTLPVSSPNRWGDACNDEEFEQWLHFIDGVYRTGTHG